MPSNSGTFTGKITKQTTMSLTEQPAHDMNIAEVAGTRKSPVALWNNSKIAYWGVTDLLDGEGSQRGCFNNIHPDGGRDFGTFDVKAAATASGMTVEGTYKITGGDGQYHGIGGGGGKFKTTMKSETEIECIWDRNYELAKAEAN
jgi:hypothetical protein